MKADSIFQPIFRSRPEAKKVSNLDDCRPRKLSSARYSSRLPFEGRKLNEDYFYRA